MALRVAEPGLEFTTYPTVSGTAGPPRLRPLSLTAIPSCPLTANFMTELTRSRV
jgi:hypothetical protein